MALFRQVCMMRPETDSPAPAMMAAQHAGQADVPDDTQVGVAAPARQRLEALGHGHAGRADEQAHHRRQQHRRQQQPRGQPLFAVSVLSHRRTSLF